MQHNDGGVNTCLLAAVRRNPDILSATFRGAGGKLLAHAGQDASAEGEGQSASEDMMTVPISLGKQVRGAVEVRFRPARFGFISRVGGPVLPLIAFIGAASFLGVSTYLRSALRHADGSETALVPDRVRATLNTVAEGVLVLDKQQRIALANDAFAQDGRRGCRPL